MTTTHVVMACVVACISASFTDWLFFGVLFHERYKAFPEVWRRAPGAGGEGKDVGVSIVIGFLTPLCFVLLCRAVGLSGVREVRLLVLAPWGATALPLLATNYIFMKIHPLVLVSHSLGWLAKLAVSGAAVIGLMR
jgi:hypothetical protein